DPISVARSAGEYDHLLGAHGVKKVGGAMEPTRSKAWGILAAAGFGLACAGIAAGQDQNLDTAKIEQATGLKGTWNKDEGVFKVSSPRADLKVSVDRWT